MAGVEPVSPCKFLTSLSRGFGISSANLCTVNFQPKGPSDSGAESPTTARPLEMDDDDVQESGVLAEDGTTTMASSNPASDQNTAEFGPPKPPRPLTEAQKNNLMLKEAFPTVEDGIIRAVLSASGGEVEPAFNALLGTGFRWPASESRTHGGTQR